jgi:hypothetical protein
MGRLTFDEKKELSKVIDRIPFMVGGEPFGEDFRPVQELTSFIEARFPTVRAENVQEAFELAACGQLTDGAKPVDIRTYGKPVSMEFVGRVLAAYNDRQRQRTEIAKPYTESIRMVGEIQKPTGEEMYNGMIEIIQRDGCMPFAYPWSIIYAYMVGRGWVQHVKKTEADSRRRRYAHLIGEQIDDDVERKAIERYLKGKGILR